MEFWTESEEPMIRELENVAVPPRFVVPRTSRLLAITEPKGAKNPPRVIISPRAPKFPRVEMDP
jgi:hypothetical protein